MRLLIRNPWDRTAMMGDGIAHVSVGISYFLPGELLHRIDGFGLDAQPLQLDLLPHIMISVNLPYERMKRIRGYPLL